MHKRRHSRKKAFPCGICDLAFTFKSHLIRHKRIHTVTPTSTSFVDCGETDLFEIKEEETLDEDPLNCKIEAENEVMIKEEIKEEELVSIKMEADNVPQTFDEDPLNCKKESENEFMIKEEIQEEEPVSINMVVDNDEIIIKEEII